jgi:hypothetical protein
MMVTRPDIWQSKRGGTQPVLKNLRQLVNALVTAIDTIKDQGKYPLSLSVLQAVGERWSLSDHLHDEICCIYLMLLIGVLRDGDEHPLVLTPAELMDAEQL